MYGDEMNFLTIEPEINLKLYFYHLFLTRLWPFDQGLYFKYNKQQKGKNKLPNQLLIADHYKEEEETFFFRFSLFTHFYFNLSPIFVFLQNHPFEIIIESNPSSMSSPLYLGFELGVKTLS